MLFALILLAILYGLLLAFIEIVQFYSGSIHSV